jgi:MYXO-CTERM domain-containing protein
MRRRQRNPVLGLLAIGSLRRVLLGLVVVPGLVVVLGTSVSVVPAAASSTDVAQAEAIEEARRWQGRWGPVTGCGPPASASAASVGGFAAAALGAVVLSRRRRP